MSYSPYESPQTESHASKFTGAPNRENLRLVAKYQRWVMYSLLAMLGANILTIATLRQDFLVQMVVTAVAIGVVAFAIVSIFLLASRLMHVALAVFCGLMMFVPCFSLLTLLIVNQTATSYLQKHGVKVGFMGANPNTI